MSSTAPSDPPPSMAEIDALLDDLGGDQVTATWLLDRPLLPREALATLRRHQADPNTMAANARREIVRAAADQLRLQADAFRCCRAALLAGDASMVHAGNPLGSGYDEVRELLTDAAELGRLLRDPAAPASLAREHEALAEAFGVAAEKCAAIAERLDAVRFTLHARDYLAMVNEHLDQDADETARRKRCAEGTP